MSDIDDIDFFQDDGVLADPYPYLDALRERCPVSREPHHDVVMVTGYDEAIAVYNDVDRFSSCSSVTGPFPGFPVPLDGLSRDEIDAAIARHRDELPMSDQLPTLDPPTHTDHRSLLNRLITPKRLAENEAFISKAVDRLLDDVLTGETCELNGEFAGPLAMLVIADLLGVPEGEHDLFREALLHPGGTIGSTGGDHITHNPLEFLYQRFTGYIEQRRAEPTGDVLTGLATATFPDGSVPEVGDVVRVAANLFAAGQETTVRLLTSGAMLLAEDAGLQARLRAEPALVTNFVEECLRTESPVKGDFRLTRCPVTIGGVDVPAGATVMVLNAAANRDPRRFPDPGTFDPERAEARQHVAFGRGIHTCPGAPLARAEARIAFRRLLARTTAITVSAEHHGPPGARRYRYVPTFILRGLTHLHLDIEPAPRGGGR